MDMPVALSDIDNAWPRGPGAADPAVIQRQSNQRTDRSEKPAGYSVRYRLGNQEVTVRMDHDPGERIPVKDGHLVLGNPGDQPKQNEGA